MTKQTKLTLSQTILAVINCPNGKDVHERLTNDQRDVVARCQKAAPKAPRDTKTALTAVHDIVVSIAAGLVGPEPTTPVTMTAANETAMVAEGVLPAPSALDTLIADTTDENAFDVSPETPVAPVAPLPLGGPSKASTRPALLTRTVNDARLVNAAGEPVATGCTITETGAVVANGTPFAHVRKARITLTGEEKGNTWRQWQWQDDAGEWKALGLLKTTGADRFEKKARSNGTGRRGKSDVQKATAKAEKAQVKVEKLELRLATAKVEAAEALAAVDAATLAAQNAATDAAINADATAKAEADAKNRQTMVDVLCAHWNGKKVGEIKAEAKARKIAGRSKLSKVDLIKAIAEATIDLDLATAARAAASA